METKILVLNGPNLNLLGEREPDIYGRTTLAELDRSCVDAGRALGLSVTCAQSNHEGVLIDHVQAARATTRGLVINAGAFSHTSVALLDALSSYPGPIVEVHLSNIFRREAFRHHSYVSAVAHGVICGLGVEGYRLALTALANVLGPPAAGPAAQPGL